MVSHSEPYIALADGLVGEQTIVYGMDLRGHGHSEGVRGDYAVFQDFLDDIGAMLQFLADRYPRASFILCGESMGGLAATLFAATGQLGGNQVSLAGLLLWAPAYRPVLGGMSFRDVFMGIGMVLKLIFCRKRVSIGALHEKTFRDPASQAYDETDPLNLPAYSARYLWNINSGMGRLKALGAGRLTIPVCIVHGADDQVVSQPASAAFFEGLAPQVKGANRYFLIPNAWHCIYKDPDFTTENWHQVTEFIARVGENSP
jgi:alpha-beta hydrolase superfamily lysophospholipase